MKRALVSIILFAAVCLPSMAQDTLIVVPQGKKVSISVAGYQVNIVPEIKEKQEKVEPQMDFNLIGPFYHGWSLLTGSQYYGDWADQGDFLAPSHLFSFGMSFCKFSVSLNPENSLILSLGARWTFTRYTLKQPVVFIDDMYGHTQPVFADSFDKGYIYQSYMGAPLGLSYKYGKFMVTANVSAEGLLSSYSKLKQDNVKYEFSALSRFKSNLDLILSYGFFGAYASYGLTPMFTKGSGNDCHMLTFGFIFGM